MEGDPRYAALERRLRGDAPIHVPTLVIHGGADPCNDPSTSAGKQALFTGGYRRCVLEGVGHFPQHKAPREVGELIANHLDG